MSAVPTPNEQARALQEWTPRRSYRGWAISFEYGYYYATSPNYDASWEGEEDGWVDNGERVCARDRQGLYEEVDAWFDENKARGEQVAA